MSATIPSSTHAPTPGAPPYPIQVRALQDDSLSRWLWLVKWLLIVPHVLILIPLWVAFFVLSLVAAVAIVITGRYPRSIFDFNVGVLRWSWRVSYYAYNALGTDRYPPFALREISDYPTGLNVDYPARLHRGLVLVKWFLAIPHLLIVGILFSGSAWASQQAGGAAWSWGGGGLVALLVLIAGVVLAFSGRYPRPLFDLILGLNRWGMRVVGYVALMTDRYPPFRLDLGGDDPAGEVAVPVGPPVVHSGTDSG